MRARRPLAFVIELSIGLVCFLRVVPSCLAQDPAIDTAEVQPADCPPLSTFPQLAASVVVSCDKSDSVEVTMPLKPDAQGRAREKKIRGAYEFREYRIPRIDEQERAFDNLMQLIPIAGFIVKFAASPLLITALNGETWMLINVNGDSYDVKVVRDTQKHCTAVKSAEGISREVQAHKRVAIYGIQFSPGSQMIQEDKSEILSEVLKYLKQNPDTTFVIESHKVSTKGSVDDDLEITRKRANAVLDWLVGHGIPPARVQAKPIGRGEPLTENDTPAEIQCNDRIELATATP